MPVKWNVEREIRRVQEAVERGVEATAEWVRDESVRKIVEPPKTGRVYSGFPFRVGLPDHQASAPGEAPADDSGDLRRSGKVAADGLTAEVTFDAGYAGNLEYGIPTGEYPLEPRPFLRPTVLEGQKLVKGIIEKEMSK